MCVNGTKRNIEVNIFDFDRDIYGDSLSIEFIETIRKDYHFTDLEALRQQLIVDKQAAMKLLRA